MLQYNLIPRLQHQLTLGKTDKTILKKVDMLTRKFVRKTLHLPHDTPVAYIHAPYAIGGLQVPHLSSRIPIARNARIQKLLSSPDPILQWAGRIANDMQLTARSIPHIGGAPVINKKDAITGWKAAISETFDASKHIGCIGIADPSDSWLRNPSRLTPGSYIRLCKLRCGLLSTESRKARQTKAETGQKLCSSYCGKIETISHILQVCHKTHDARIHRHDKVVTSLMKMLSGPNKRILREPIIPIPTSHIKPDIIHIKGDTATVIDVSIVDPTNMLNAYEEKIKKYGTGENADSIRRYLQHEAKEVKKIIHYPCIITYNGLLMAK